MTAYSPRLHDTARDTKTHKTGKVMGFEGGYVQLRPIGGGREWDARREDLQPATAAESLSTVVAVANARSRGELP